MPANDGINESAQDGARTVELATAREVFAIPAFKERVAENQPNRHIPHNRQRANAQILERIVAVEQCGRNS